MKTENTLENKAKFMALYWGQKVMRSSINEGNVTDLLITTIIRETLKDNWFLELTPLSQITDEDAIGVAKLLWNNSQYHTVKNGSYYVKAILQFDSDIKDGFEIEMYPHNSLTMCDYLHSKGYCLPWMDLSVQDLVSYGWVKLKN